MTYKQRIKKIGNSYGIILPKTLRDRVGLSENTSVNLTPSADGKSLILSTEKPKIDPDFFSLLDSVSKEYKEALDALAR